MALRRLVSDKDISAFETSLSDGLLRECESASKAELAIAMLLSTYVLGAETGLYNPPGSHQST